jgi:hypothetical protein
MSVYDSHAFSERVTLAEKNILAHARNPYRHEFSRSFDTCFEMGDGDKVAARLWRKAETNAELLSAMERVGFKK